MTDGVVVLIVAVKDINIEVFGLTAPASPHLGSRIDLMTVKLLPRHFRGILSLSLSLSLSRLVRPAGLSGDGGKGRKLPGGI